MFDSKETTKEASAIEISENWVDRLDRWLSLLLKAILIVGVVLEVTQANWLNAVATTGVVIIAFIPSLFGYRFHMRIPAEFELLAVVFVYASLFLGNLKGYYLKYWWWDILLHTSSGLILGILGFLLVYVINEHEDIEMHMKPSFVALFAFMFSIGMGAIWEIFEFSLDQLFGMTTQLGGLQDTMVDLIVDGAGALFISLLGYSYLSDTNPDSFLERRIHNFIKLNQRFFPNKKFGSKRIKQLR